MDIKRAQTCMQYGIAVMYKGRKYYRINAIVSRKYIAGEPMDNRPPRMQAILYDGVGNAVEIVPVEDLTLVPEGGGANAADGNV